MQEREFDKLMDGKEAKWLEMKKPPQFDNPFQLTLMKGEPKEKQREIIKENETPIPEHISREIHKYVKEEREKKVSERAIRRAVKRKWNIYVV